MAAATDVRERRVDDGPSTAFHAGERRADDVPATVIAAVIAPIVAVIDLDDV
jgi:hypothetical protein